MLKNLLLNDLPTTRKSHFFCHDSPHLCFSLFVRGLESYIIFARPFLVCISDRFSQKSSLTSSRVPSKTLRNHRKGYILASHSQKLCIFLSRPRSTIAIDVFGSRFLVLSAHSQNIINRFLLNILKPFFLNFCHDQKLALDLSCRRRWREINICAVPSFCRSARARWLMISKGPSTTADFKSSDEP